MIVYYIFFLNNSILMQYLRTFSTAFILNVNLYYFRYRYLYKYQEAMPVEQVVKSICNYKQAYTQYGGLRPFGVAFLFAGWDRNFGFQLYQTDPSGNYSGWKATVIGAACISSYKHTNKQTNMQEYKCIVVIRTVTLEITLLLFIVHAFWKKKYTTRSE